MPRLMLLVPALVLAASGASAQTAGGGVSTPQVTVFTSPSTSEVTVFTNVGGVHVAPPGHDLVISRLLSFDRNGDGTITIGDLPERMQPRLARGDTNGDGRLDAAEIEALVRRPGNTQRSFFPGTYGFADQFSFSSRSHVEGAIADLKLPEPLSERALAIATSFVDRLEAEARAELLAELAELLTPDQIATVEVRLDAQLAGRGTFRIVGLPITAAVQGASSGTAVETVHALLVNSAVLHLPSLSLPAAEAARARTALTRYMERVKLAPDTRAGLLEDLQGTLDGQQQADLQAALERRPMMPLDNRAGAPGGSRLQTVR